MYRKRGADINLADVLAKIRNESAPLPAPIVYAPTDISAAKKVLDRLLSAASASEVSYIRVIPEEVTETETEEF